MLKSTKFQRRKNIKEVFLILAKLLLVSSVPRGSGREPVAHVRLEVIRQQPGAVSAFRPSEAPSEVFTAHFSRAPAP